MNVSRLSGKAFGLLGKVAGWLGVTKSAISKLRSRRIRLGEDKAVMGDLVKGWEEEVVFTGAEQVVDKESEEEPIPVSCPVEIGSECSKMSCNMFEIYIRLAFRRANARLMPVPYFRKSVRVSLINFTVNIL